MPEQLQRTEKWWKDKLGCASASNASIILAQGKSSKEAKSRTKYKAELVRQRLTGGYSSRFNNDSMDWGIETEELAKLAYECATNRSIDDCGFIKHPKVKNAGASPDGLIGIQGTVQIKCPDTSTYQEIAKEGKIDNKYIKQVQFELWITGREWCDFIVFDPRMPENAQLFIKRIYRDQKMISLIEFQTKRFLKEVSIDEKFFKNYKVKK